MANNTADLGWIDCHALRRDEEARGNGRGGAASGRLTPDNLWKKRLRLIEPDGSVIDVPDLDSAADEDWGEADLAVADIDPDAPVLAKGQAGRSASREGRTGNAGSRSRKAEASTNGPRAFFGRGSLRLIEADGSVTEVRRAAPGWIAPVADMGADGPLDAGQGASARRPGKAQSAAAQRAKVEEAERARQAAEEEARLANEAREKAEAEAQALKEAEAKAKADARRLAKEKAEAQAREREEEEARALEEARQKAAAEAKAKVEAKAKEEAAAKAEAEEKARLEAEAEAKAQAEEKARLEAQAKAQAKAKAQAEAEEKARLAAEEKAKAEAEEKARLEAEAAAKAEAEAQAQAKAKKEAEAKAAREAEKKAEAERKAQEAEDQKARAQAEAAAKKAAEAKAKKEAQAAAKAKAEADEKAAREKEAEETAALEAETKAEAEAKERSSTSKAPPPPAGADIDLLDSYRRLIPNTGPISLSQFMGESNARYYASRDPLGEEGDFITAPEVSQMFGELIGLWFADLWVKMGSSKRIHFVELGPGRGTLSRDALRAAGRYEFDPTIHFVEGSPALREIQKESFPDVIHHDDLSTLPEDRPLLIVANEFFDALPIKQLIRSADGWHERMVGLDGEELQFVVGEERVDDLVPPSWRNAPQGTMIETSPAANALMTEIAERLKNQGGAALIIDYGPLEARSGSTLQAIMDHSHVDPLRFPGDADLTAHVDFERLSQVAEESGAEVMGLQMQGEWLHQMGIETRLEALKRKDPDQADVVQRQHDRLVRDDQMGALFKVLGVCGRRWPFGFGFE